MSQKTFTFEKYVDGEWQEVDALDMQAGDRIRPACSEYYMELRVKDYELANPKALVSPMNMPEMHLVLIHPAFWKGPVPKLHNQAVTEGTEPKGEQTTDIKVPRREEAGSDIDDRTCPTEGCKGTLVMPSKYIDQSVFQINNRYTGVLQCNRCKVFKRVALTEEELANNPAMVTKPKF